MSGYGCGDGAPLDCRSAIYEWALVAGLTSVLLLLKYRGCNANVRSVWICNRNDEYLFWTIAEGGAPVGSAIPAFKDTLTEDEIWKIVAAMRAGFPVAGEPEAQAEPTRESVARDLSMADVRAQLEQWVLWYGNPRLQVGSVIEKNDKTILGEIVTLDDSVVQRVEVDRETGWMRPVQ